MSSKHASRPAGSGGKSSRKPDPRVYKASRKNRTWLYILLAILLLAIIGMGGTIVSRSMGGDTGDYAVYLDQAEKYITEGNYSQAIVQLKMAIEAEPEQAEAYMRLARIQADRGYTMTAIGILDEGIGRTGSQDLIDYKDSLAAAAFSQTVQTSQEGRTAEVKVASAGSGGGSGARFNTLYINKIGTSSSSELDYFCGQGDLLSEKYQGYTQVRYLHPAGNGIPMTVLYMDDPVSGKVLDSRGRPLPGAHPAMIIFDSVYAVLDNFIMEDRTDLDREELTKILGSTLTVASDGDQYFMDYVYAQGITIRFMCNRSGFVSADQKAYLLLEPYTEEETEERAANGAYTSVVLDAMDGEGLEGVHCVFTGPSTHTTTSNNNGSFNCTLEPGNWTLTLSKEGYNNVVSEFTLEAGENRNGDQHIMSPVLASGQLRIVLTWGDQPSDLDSHLVGTMDNGTRVHVYWVERQAPGNIANLDVDDITSFGPETTTINDLNGQFDFYVHNYSQTGNMGSVSGARITVYLQNGHTETVNVNPSCTDFWHVLRIDHGNVTILNTAESM